LRKKGSFIIQLPHSLFLVQYSKQLHVNSQAGGLKVSSLSGREREQRLRKKGSFIIQLPHSLFLVQYSKQPHINSQAGGLMVCSLAGREREHKRWRSQTMAHSFYGVVVFILLQLLVFFAKGTAAASSRPTGREI
jgi:hypothetical protein